MQSCFPFSLHIEMAQNSSDLSSGYVKDYIYLQFCMGVCVGVRVGGGVCGFLCVNVSSCLCLCLCVSSCLCDIARRSRQQRLGFPEVWSLSFMITG